MKKALVGLGIVALLLGAAAGTIRGINHARLQGPMNEVIASDSRNVGIEVSVHYRHWVFPGALVYDLRRVPGDKAPIDLFRVMLQFAARVKDREFDEVELAFQGKTKFKLDGRYFRQLGQEYGDENPVYTLRTFPENVKRIDGTQAFASWEGGILGVTGKQMEDFSDFITQWVR